jgi:hypothetical protein
MASVGNSNRRKRKYSHRAKDPEKRPIVKSRNRVAARANRLQAWLLRGAR